MSTIKKVNHKSNHCNIVLKNMIVNIFTFHIGIYIYYNSNIIAYSRYRLLQPFKYTKKKLNLCVNHSIIIYKGRKTEVINTLLVSIDLLI